LLSAKRREKLPYKTKSRKETVVEEEKKRRLLNSFIEEKEKKGAGPIIPSHRNGEVSKKTEEKKNSPTRGRYFHTTNWHHQKKESKNCLSPPSTKKGREKNHSLNLQPKNGREGRNRVHISLREKGRALFSAQASPPENKKKKETISSSTTGREKEVPTSRGKKRGGKGKPCKREGGDQMLLRSTEARYE